MYLLRIDLLWRIRPEYSLGFLFQISIWLSQWGSNDKSPSFVQESKTLKDSGSSSHSGSGSGSASASGRGSASASGSGSASDSVVVVVLVIVW